MNNHIEKVFRDPVHGYISVNHPIILKLINTKEFQRLRRIKQLGVTSEVFHGAEHSRFEHSLGTYEIARKICNYFSNNFRTQSKDDGLWDDNECLVTLCAALLHDVGHGAYSHTFEHLFNTNHEKITCQIITNPTTEINQVLKQVSLDFPQKVASVINHTYPNKQVIQIISSQIDADRMDYLLRDAYFTGVNYGRFDLNRILESMRPFNNQIVFDISGMHAVEDYVLSRFQMYQQIYFHPTTSSMEIILSKLLQRIKDNFKNNKLINNSLIKPLEPFLNENWNIEDYLKLDDQLLISCFNLMTNNDDPIIADLADRFINRKPFKSVIYNDKSINNLNKLKRQIQKIGYDVNFYTDTNDTFDYPYSQDNEITFINKDYSTVKLSKLSKLITAIINQKVGEKRFFFPKELLSNDDLFKQEKNLFNTYIKNGHILES